MYLLDTNVISELRRGKNKADKNVIDWASNVAPGTLFLSAITIFEVEIGILSKERKDKLQGQMLKTWFRTQVLPEFSNRIISVDTKIALQCAKLHVPDPSSGRDAFIAATALVHGMTIITRNSKDFTHTGVKVFNPWLETH